MSKKEKKHIQDYQWETLFCWAHSILRKTLKTIKNILKIDEKQNGKWITSHYQNSRKDGDFKRICRLDDNSIKTAERHMGTKIIKRMYKYINFFVS